MYETDWYEPHSDYCDGLIVGMALYGTSWDDIAKEGDESGRFCLNFYGEKEELVALELPVEGESYIDEEDVEDYPYPQKPADYSFKKWCQAYLTFAMDDDLEDLLGTPIAITKENGLFVFAVGFPYQDGGFPVVEIFYATYGDKTVKHFTWSIDDTPSFLFQDGSFLYAILKKLKLNGELKNTIDPYGFFKNDAYVNKYKRDLDWICNSNSASGDFCVTPESEWTARPEEDITQSGRVDNTENVLLFDKREHFAFGNGLEIPVPDGYHYDQCGTGVNMGWSYIVPCDVSLGENHIDAQPYSFGITSDPVSHAPFESKHIEAFKQVFISGGLLDEDVLVDTFTVSDHCAFLYQNWYDSAANLYNKINGFLLAGNDVYQFHIYANHTEPISQDEDTIAAFLEVGRAWMRQVVLNEDQEETTYTAPGTFSTSTDSDFEMDDDEEGKLTNYIGTVSDVVIPHGVKIIGENTFLMKEITSVVIPEGVTELEDSAFWGCKKLNSVQLPSTLEKIGPDAFRGCESLTSIVIPEGVCEIESDAFSFCTSLKNIYLPDSLWNIGLDAFSTFCDDMVLHVPQYSEAETYAQDNDLKHDHKKPPKTTAKKRTTKKNTTEAVEEAPDSAPQEPVEPFQLTNKGKTLDKYMGKETEVVVPEGITTIAGFAFDSTSVKTVMLPSTVKKIGNYAFSDCSKLTQINIPSSVTSIEDCAFNKCSGLKEIVFPGSVKKLPNRVCDYCNALTKVVVEEGITEIKASAFSFCENLTDIFLPMSLTKIGDHLLLCSGKPTMHVYSGSYAEEYAQENELPVEIVLTPEQEAEKKRQEEARRIAEEKYAAELKAWEQACGETRVLREQRVSELLEEKRAALKKEVQSTYDAAVAAANKRKEAAQQKKTDAEKRLSTLGLFKFAEKKEANATIQESENEIQAAESALVAAKQTLDKGLATIPATINSQRYIVSREVEYEYPLPTKPIK